MLLPTLRLGRRSRAYADNRLGRLCRALDGANVSYGRSSPETALQRLPISAPPPRTPRLTGQPFRSPLEMPSKTAVVDAGFAPDPAMHEFAAEDIRLLIDYAPEALVLSLGLALHLATQKRRPQVSNWMVVLTSLAGVPFEQEHRDLLWRSFAVPVFEQLRGWDGAVIARECEVHSGLHVDPNAAILESHEGELVATQLTTFAQPILRARTGLTAELTAEHCECGAETPRIRHLALVRQKARYAVA